MIGCPCFSCDKVNYCVVQFKGDVAKHKSCFLRADTGPCRADIIQWYFDAKQETCYRFFWGGCQGNGNRFETADECIRHCLINMTDTRTMQPLPHFCRLSFDYGTCFGHYQRWAYDNLYKTCKQYIYSGCGGNQNNFETKDACYNTCLTPPKNSLMESVSHLTTCFPLESRAKPQKDKKDNN